MLGVTSVFSSIDSMRLDGSIFALHQGYRRECCFQPHTIMRARMYMSTPKHRVKRSARRSLRSPWQVDCHDGSEVIDSSVTILRNSMLYFSGEHSSFYDCAKRYEHTGR